MATSTRKNNHIKLYQELELKYKQRGFETRRVGINLSIRKFLNVNHETSQSSIHAKVTRRSEGATACLDIKDCQRTVSLYFRANEKSDYIDSMQKLNRIIYACNLIKETFEKLNYKTCKK